MLTEEDVESWNQLFPDCQINTTNLGNPTERFLINALVCYLRRFGYKIEPPFDLNTDINEHNKEIRLFLIKLSRQIDHFLKITDKVYSFTYYDLIRPTPKKTAHMLYILLNYYYYYNLFKEDVFKMAGEKIHKLEELKDLIAKTRFDNEQKNEEMKNMKYTMEKLKEEVPVARTKFKELDKRRSIQEEEYEKIKHSYQDLKERLKHLEEQKKLLRKRVVAKEEFQELQNQLQQSEIDLVKLKQTESTNVAYLNECKESNVSLQNLIKEVEQAHGIIPSSRIKQVQETNKQLSQSQKEENDLKIKQSSLLQEIEKEKANKLSLEREQQNKKLLSQSKQTNFMSTVTTKQNILKQKDTEILHLQEEEHISDCQLEEQKDIAQYLGENLSEILSAYED